MERKLLDIDNVKRILLMNLSTKEAVTGLKKVFFTVIIKRWNE